MSCNSAVTRRQMLLHSAGAAASMTLGASMVHSTEPIPVRVVTNGPKHHWFGYYDKLQFDPSGRYLLGMEVDFEHRSPTAEDTVTVGMVDLQESDRWIPLGTSNAWCWQQGCMLQWLPGSKHEVIWNDRDGDRFISRIANVHSGKSRVIPHAIYCVNPDGRSALAPDFRRINDVRPGYGYVGLADPNAEVLAPENSGIAHIDLVTGKAQTVLTLLDVARTGKIPNEKFGIKHYFNHLLYSPSGDRFIALHRWRYPDGSRLTRMITARPDGSGVRIVCPNGYTSHFIWRDDHHILAQSRHYDGNASWGNFLFEDVDGGGDVREIGRGVLNPNGHITYLPGNDWILNDTYPKGSQRLQTPHLYHVETGKRIDLGSFHLPKIYSGEWRVDTHPRISPDGQRVCIDAPAEGAGRQMHVIDIQGLIG